MRNLLTKEQKIARYMTEAQKTAILDMRREIAITASDSYRGRTLRGLVAIKVAEYDPETKTFSLTPEWMTMDLEGNKPRRNEPVRPIPAPTPDPVRKMKRPPAVYSNPNWEDEIDHILKTY